LGEGSRIFGAAPHAASELTLVAEEINVTGLTGVDLSLKVAGPGTRSYAFVIDWHIRALIAVAWILVGVLVHVFWSQQAPGWRSPQFVLWFTLPALLIYFLYHPVLEVAMRGRTPGKRIAHARVVTRSGTTPGTGALLVRNLFRIIDSLPLCYVVGLVCTMLTAQRVRIGDMAAGTVLVLDTAPAEMGLGKFNVLADQGAGQLDPAALELIHEVIQRWPTLAPDKRVAFAHSLLCKFERASDRADFTERDPDALRRRLQALLITEPAP
jgi:uncharacterized RDD family membrane protein YckC